jgi:hypothetical protein
LVTRFAVLFAAGGPAGKFAPIKTKEKAEDKKNKVKYRISVPLSVNSGHFNCKTSVFISNNVFVFLQNRAGCGGRGESEINPALLNAPRNTYHPPFIELL